MVVGVINTDWHHDPEGIFPDYVAANMKDRSAVPLGWATSSCLVRNMRAYLDRSDRLTKYQHDAGRRD